MVTFWKLWYNQNRCLHEMACKTPTIIVLAINRTLEDYKSVHEREKTGDNQEQEQLTAPPSGFLKINTNVAYYVSSKEA